MTREEILAMEPGSTLDSLVAEKVMGWMIDDEAFCPSSYISDAWEVEEKMGNDELFWKYANHVKKQLLTRFGKVTEYDMMHAPADVRCKAALLAVMDA